MNLPKILTIALTFFTISTNAQNTAKIEGNLLKALKKISYWADRTNLDYGYDSLSAANQNFEGMLKNYAEKYPALLKAPLTSLKKEHLYVATSPDGLFRIYSWDTLEGGTMHFFGNVIQFAVADNKTKATIVKAAETENLPYYTNIYSFINNNHIYYLGVFKTIYSSRDISDGVKAFNTEGGILNPAKLIKTKTGIYSSIAYSYNFMSVADMPFEQRPAISFDEPTKTLKLPLVDANENLTKKFVLYKFTGQYFERQK